MNTYSITTHLLLVAVCLAFSIGASELTPCDVPSEVSHCMNLMRTREDFDDATISNFMNLQEKMENLRMDSCDWKGADLKMTAGDCVTTLSRFVEEKGNGADMMLQNSVRISGKECRKRCRSVCDNAPPAAQPGCKRICKGVVPNAEVNISVKECRVRCRRRCRFAPASAKSECRGFCNQLV